MKKSFMEPKHKVIKCCLIMSILMGALNIFCQTKIKGDVIEKETGEPLIGANVALEASGEGAVSDWDGSFEFETSQPLPITLTISYLGYVTQTVEVADGKVRLKISLEEEAITITQVEVVGQRISDKQKQAPLTVESLDAIAIKQTASTDFYNGLGALKGVDLTTASIGFTIINTRGFNSTSPVRSLQIIDGVDNQSPGLNFSLGNFLGAPELDILNVNIVAGASSAYYGPNAFNGVISMETKNPFFHKGLSASLKTGERSLFEGAMRYADVIKNKNGKPFLGYKFNFSYLKAYDWVADNYEPISESEGSDLFPNPALNPGGFNAVNIYGDEYSRVFSNDYFSGSGLNTFYRRGYKEVDLVDYNTKNIKSGVALHFRTKPSLDFESPELIIGSNFGYGTTVYQGDNRFSLRGIQFYQHKLEFRKKDKYFIRLYSTNEDAGDSYDPYFTAQKLIDASATNSAWENAYEEWWIQKNLGDVFNKMKSQGFSFDNQNTWQQENREQLLEWHKEAQQYASTKNNTLDVTDFYEPGTQRFDSLFNEITSKKNNELEGGTRFFDKSRLIHGHAEYKWETNFFREIVLGGNARFYRPNSEGTIFKDDSVKIKNSEIGFYSGLSKQFSDFIATVTGRMDKNQNFDWLFSPAASLVWKPSDNNFLRVSFSSAIRNPTLSDQYLDLEVGPARLLGNLTGFDSLITFESFRDWRKNPIGGFDYRNIDPIRPEKVKTVEVGYRTTLFNKLYLDGSYYYNIYNDFIGYQIGIYMPIIYVEIIPGFPPQPIPNINNISALRVAANSSETVNSQGFAVGFNYFFNKYYSLNGNYSYNNLVTNIKDNIVPAFNTPKNKFNVGLSGRDIPFVNKNTLGFNVNYKWIEGFTFEGSPQFTGLIPTYDLLDAQINCTLPSVNSVIKIGASNIMNNKQFQTYGGPRIGRLAYISLIYDFKKKI